MGKEDGDDITSSTATPVVVSEASTSSHTASSSTIPPLHAQAVRFLTSLRHHSPNASVEAQREFLKSKGLDESAIEAAFQDAARPSSLASTASTTSVAGGTGEGLSEEEAFDAAARAFEDPIHTPAPVLPAKNYPRSPLALYYEEAQGRVDEVIRREEGARRYQVLLGYFRSLSWLLTFGGGLGAIGVMIYKLYVMPKLVATLDARSFLIKHHHSLWSHIVRSVRNLSTASLAPAKSASAVSNNPDSDKSRGGGQGRRSSLKKVQFADEINGGSLEQREGEVPSSPPTKITQIGHKVTSVVLPGTDVIVPAATKSLKDATVDAEEEVQAEEREEEVQPIDVSEPLRTSLALLTQKLRGQTENPGQSTIPMPFDGSTQVSANKSTTVADDEEESSSDGSWQDEVGSDEEELELDPFAAPIRKDGKRRGSSSHKKRKTTTTTTTSVASGSSTGHADASTGNGLNESSGVSKALYDTLVDLNSSINARILTAQSLSFRMSNIGGAYGSINFAPPISSSSRGVGGDGTKDGEQGDPVGETSAQIRAEIRSLKGLLLSRRNFPRPNGALGRPPPPPPPSAAFPV